MIARARKNEATYMRLAVHHRNDAAMDFYRRLGFTEPDDRIFVLEGEGLAAMERG